MLAGTSRAAHQASLVDEDGWMGRRSGLEGKYPTSLSAKLIRTMACKAGYTRDRDVRRTVPVFHTGHQGYSQRRAATPTWAGLF